MEYCVLLEQLTFELNFESEYYDPNSWFRIRTNAKEIWDPSSLSSLFRSSDYEISQPVNSTTNQTQSNARCVQVSELVSRKSIIINYSSELILAKGSKRNECSTFSESKVGSFGPQFKENPPKTEKSFRTFFRGFFSDIGLYSKFGPKSEHCFIRYFWASCGLLNIDYWLFIKFHGKHIFRIERKMQKSLNCITILYLGRTRKSFLLAKVNMFRKQLHHLPCKNTVKVVNIARIIISLESI